MRTHGTLTRWNDDRGFGFVTPAKGTVDIFVHISAFPRAGGCPRQNELISFEVELGPDGKQRAVRVMRASQKTAGQSPAPREWRRPQGRKLGGASMLLVVGIISAYSYSRFTGGEVPTDVSVSTTPGQLLLEPAPNYSCDGRNMCLEMTSCDEATFFIRNCPNTKMDGDGDGVPCESLWCN